MRSSQSVFGGLKHARDMCGILRGSRVGRKRAQDKLKWAVSRYSSQLISFLNDPSGLRPDIENPGKRC